MSDKEDSKYCKSGYRVSYDQNLAEKYQPIIYDRYRYAIENNPVLYYRIMEYDTTKCIQYYYYWDKQDCTKDYTIAEPNTVSFLIGLFFAVTENIITNLLSNIISQIFLIPWWIQFIAFFLLGALIGNKFHNEINDKIIFQRLAGFFVGRFFTHEFDFEPILIFIKNNQIEKVVVSGKGDVDAQPHRIDIYVDQNFHSEGESTFNVSTFLQTNDTAKEDFKEFPLNSIIYENNHPKMAVITCYHAFTADKQYYDEDVFVNLPIDFTLTSLRDEVLDVWYKQKGFGHDVSDPFDFPYIKFTGELKNKNRPTMLSLLDALSKIMMGLIMLKSLATKSKL